MSDVMGELFKSIARKEPETLSGKELLDRGVYRTVNNVVNAKHKFIPNMSFILPDQGWVVIVKQEMPNQSPEGLGVVKKAFRVAVKNPKSVGQFKETKELTKFLNAAKVPPKEYLETGVQQNAFNKYVDSFLAEKQIAGDFKF